MRFIELFAGIGGFRYGLEKASPKFKCVWTSEWLEKPASIYEKHFGDKPDRRDIRDVSGQSLPNADLIVGGFPCATFSLAGKRTGLCLEDARGTLCFEMFRIAMERGIPYILFENVKGLLSNDDGKTFGVIIASLDEMGYDCQWELLDSQYFGVPQHRERIFLIANLRGKPRPQVFPITETNGEDAENRFEAQGEGEGFREQDNRGIATGTLCHRLYGGNTNNQYINESEVAQWRRGYFRPYRSEGTPTLTANMGTGGHNVPFVKGVMVGSSIRKLTPKECERLQGLPDDYTRWRHDGKENSDSERYERCGRTVTIPVIEAIGRKLCKIPSSVLIP